MKSALIIVDIQYDFLPGGRLPVKGGDQVIPVINAVQGRFAIVAATQDWHPVNHASFAGSHPGKNPGDVVAIDGVAQTLWPTHCVQDTRGASLSIELERRFLRRIFHKGVEGNVDSYSTFFDNAHRRDAGLDAYLKAEGVTDVYFAGLATDYCVKYSALDAAALGYAAHVIIDACRGIDLKPGDIDAAIAEMKSAGVRIVESKDIAFG